MIVIDIKDLLGTEREVQGPGWTSRHILRGGTEDMRLVCTFHPPVTGREVRDKDGAYLPDET